MAHFIVFGKVISISNDVAKEYERRGCPLDNNSCEKILYNYYSDGSGRISRKVKMLIRLKTDTELSDIITEKVRRRNDA